ncbi:DUF4097 family beta strand repeat protein [Nakamurella flavida]|uniref:DUF4097 family beta strand repeat protein n=1 Tax=Nakamurella flavida TaxID=363630 RepID=A0A938YKP3_9ACTN|nr:DUF4097 family beta strand repeat-containing protein [Nakamurella flavida]MBM9475054.1 DUF4097 family beta strand repeat protein [Nakamurella flavida]MDP9776623.1 hypothetical protein [Nakamurella flavida]
MDTFLTPEPIVVEVRNAAGDIRIDLTDTHTTTVEVGPATGGAMSFLDGVLRSAGVNRDGDEPLPRVELIPARPGRTDPTADTTADRSTTERPAGRARLVVDTDPARTSWRSAFSVVVTAPAGSDVRVQSQAADLTVHGPAHHVDARTASGTVVLQEANGSLAASTASGAVTVGSTGEQIDIRTASGDITVGSVQHDATVATTSGAVRLTTVQAPTSVRSVSGRVTVADLIGGGVEITSVSGDVVVGVHPGTAAALTLHTASGTAGSDLEITPEAPDSSSPASIAVTSTSGDIRVRSSVPA